MRYAAAIHDLFAPHGAFEEYNSPTYYGVDLYALALWRAHGASPRLRQLGAAMEAALWRDIARYYHAGLRNLAGPYDRSYGMDMRRYASLVGMWIWLAAGRANAPFPDQTQPFDQSWDFGSAPLYAVLGARVPDDALPHFRTFQGERLVAQVLSDTPRRVATAWIGERLLLGGERGGGGHRNWLQFHPATLHWRLPDGAVGWCRLRATRPADAVAGRGTLDITCEGGVPEVVFEVDAPGAAAAHIRRERWELPGLVVQVETSAPELYVAARGGRLELRYRTDGAPLRFALRAQA